MTTTWLSEFGAEYEVPQEILDSGLIDTSWHNDACPSFGNSGRAGLNPPNQRGIQTEITLWVEHPDPTQRELPGPRFLVVRSTRETRARARRQGENERFEKLYIGDAVHLAVRAATGNSPISRQ